VGMGENKNEIFLGKMAA